MITYFSKLPNIAQYWEQRPPNSKSWFPLLENILEKQANSYSGEGKSHFKSCCVLISVDMKGQRVAHITQLACFQSALKLRRFICPKMFFGRCLVEVIVLSRSIVSLCKAMYQSAFLSLEFNLNLGCR